MYNIFHEHTFLKIKIKRIKDEETMSLICEVKFNKLANGQHCGALKDYAAFIFGNSVRDRVRLFSGSVLVSGAEHLSNKKQVM